MRKFVRSVLSVFNWVRMYQNRNCLVDISVFDIDNTLAKTNRENGQKDKKVCVSDFLVWEDVRQLLYKDRIRGRKIIIMTARPLKDMIPTLKWLRKNEINYDQLFYVEDPISKYNLIKNVKCKVDMYDDLTYGYGQNIEEYTDVIEKLKKIPNLRLIHGSEIFNLQNKD